MYGVVGVGTAPKKVIEAALNDVGTDQEFLIPWYGRVTPGLEVVYDWVLDNDNVSYSIIYSDSGKPVPGVLRAAASTTHRTTDVNREIVSLLAMAKGHTLVLWDEDNESESVKIASMSIDQGLPTLELTNGMVPIVFDGPTDPDEVSVDVENLIVEAGDENDTKFDRQTLEVMPAAVVKRMARDAGHDVKTRDTAIQALMGDYSPGQEAIPVQMVVVFNHGGKITLDLPPDTLTKVFSLVTS